MNQAVALGNNDVALIAWTIDAPIANCLGFAIHRTDEQGNTEILPAWVGFAGAANAAWTPRTTADWPVQKFSWRDLTAEHGRSYVYEIVPMTGSPGNLQALDAVKLTTNKVELTPQRSAHIRAFFNRGILSTQHLAHRLPEGPNAEPSGDSLLAHIRTPGDEVRASLAGELLSALRALPDRARDHGGRCRAALYELDDDELVGLLRDPAISTILSNAGDSTDPDATNHAARTLLHDAHADVTDRMLPDGHIGHDKFVVYSADGGSPETIMTGSTNWTSTGLCGQVNNAILIDDSGLATEYDGFWTRLRSESPSGGPATQSPAFRTGNNTPSKFQVDGSDITLWFSPNTQEPEKPPHDPPAPSDMAEVFDAIAHAQQGIFFLLFQPGTPSVLDAILDAQAANPALLVRGAATDVTAINRYETTLFQRSGQYARVAAATQITDNFSYWEKELLKAPNAHAIIHDKVVVIDPCSHDCVVVTGSHNLGYRASYQNDENFLVIRHHRRLAEAYAVHVVDVYDHYRWRYVRTTHGNSAFEGLLADDTWQQKYFGNDQAEAERTFWFQCAPADATA